MIQPQTTSRRRLPPAAPALALAALALMAGPVASQSLERLPIVDQAIGAWFFPSRSDAMAEAERVVSATPAPAKARKWLAQLTEEPHVAGTPQEKVVAEYVHERLEEFGLEAEIVRYEVFLNHPKHVALRLTEPEQTELSLREDFLSVDKDSAARDVFPAFHGYGASGTAEGQVVYANYGTPDDFKKLDDLGISPTGRIVLVRYGEVFRGLKVREAEQRGAVGVLIYSDPADDGYMKGDVYPDGPMRPPSAIQRGSVQFLSLQPGDPSTPGWPSTDGARRLAREEMTSVPSIPSLPLSYGEAEKILRHLGGPRVPDDWQGGLPFAYHAGPGGASVAMEVEMDEGLKPIYNVFGRISGTDEPERLVILGNHRDAWTHGAADPNSGTAALLETARALGAAVAAGWRPRRTIVLASWDAEEYGLVGSTEWGEDRAATLQANAVAYVNLDSAVTGPRLGAGGTPSLRDLVRSVAADVPEPLQGGSIGDAWQKHLRSEWADKAPVELDRTDRPFELHLGTLGSGSDYTVFVDHLGIPAATFGFRGSYGVYHSVYDNFRWMEKFGDPQFVYHAVAARFFGLTAMRLASAEVVPLRFGSYARALRAELDKHRRKTVRLARKGETEDGWDPGSLDFGPVLGALDTLESAGEALDQTLAELIEREDADAARRVNDRLITLEQTFLSDDGLPGRPWFRHLLYAPGTTTGYAAWPFPELAEAIENKDAELFRHGTVRVVAALNRATRRLRETASAAR
ncbi:MAG: M28 family peptidase [bacterium]|nr:M28 family peptidase [bacterium]